MLIDEIGEREPLARIVDEDVDPLVAVALPRELLEELRAGVEAGEVRLDGRAGAEELGPIGEVGFPRRRQDGRGADDRPEHLPHEPASAEHPLDHILKLRERLHAFADAEWPQMEPAKYLDEHAAEPRLDRFTEDEPHEAGGAVVTRLQGGAAARYARDELVPDADAFLRARAAGLQEGVHGGAREGVADRARERGPVDNLRCEQLEEIGGALRDELGAILRLLEGDLLRVFA